jgi:hypothetical protein
VFNDLDGKTSFAAVADDEQNGALNIGIAIPFGNIPDTNGSAKSFEFPDLLKITNNAAENKDVAIAFGAEISGTNGTDAGASTTDADNGFKITADGGLSNPAVSETGNSGANAPPTQLSYDEVAQMFQFTTDGTTAISPPGASGGSNTHQIEAGEVTINSDGGTQAVHLNVEISTAAGQKIHDYVSEESLDANGGHVSLVDQIFVGTSDLT